jgi:hypothetical protein
MCQAEAFFSPPSGTRPFGSHDFLTDTPFDANQFDRESGGFHPATSTP